MFNTDIEKRLNGMLKLSEEIKDGAFTMQVLQDEIIDLIIDLNNEVEQEVEELNRVWEECIKKDVEPNPRMVEAHRRAAEMFKEEEK